ncbi:helix-turn-helix domain-containing protein [Kribbella qitaiheensis]|uniref:Helix-turn-helix domain-containing protein n=1 Tax=Kribbella qitaiheensis TaxID=1544730 RepID=A0A7G6WW34_9ACTN|nr:helix-turn-helix transcriptional regulator [Kribbella qitaiheensis]QNE18199.1 helix-turn-helix domain-containing protein [Kribbella qitaiheensis]
MTPTAVDSVYSRTVLGRRMREHREHARVPLSRIAAELEISTAKWSRVENGVTSVRSLDIERACHVLHVTDAREIQALMELAKLTKSKSWLSSYDDVVSDNFRLYIALEAAANELCWFEPELIPGLLQTPQYARSTMALERLTGKDLAQASLERRLEVRIGRQQILTREPDPVELKVVIGEAALRRMIGGPETMAGQFEHLLEIADRDNVEIRVMPLDVEHAGIVTNLFIVLDFPPLGNGTLIQPPNVYVDGYLGFFMTAKPDEVELYRTVWTSVWATALDAQQSADAIRDRLAQLQRS